MSRFLLCAAVLACVVVGAVADIDPHAPVNGAPVAPFTPPHAPGTMDPIPNPVNPIVPSKPANVDPHKPDPAFAKYEGKACSHNGAAGVCQSTPCGGTSVTGMCKGPNAITCCVSHAAPGAKPVIPGVGDNKAPMKPNDPKADAKGKVLMPNGKPAPPGTPAGPFPYTFPYSQARHIVADFNLQRLRLYDGATMVKEYKISSGKYGIGFKSSYPATPCGKFKVVMKVGNKQPLNMIIEKLTPQGRLGKPGDSHAHMQTRILVLEGVDKQAHYDNRNTRSRSIYIHGTNYEWALGKVASHGCFRMGNKEVLELFDAVQTGVEFYAVPFNAWPQ